MSYDWAQLQIACVDEEITVWNRMRGAMQEVRPDEHNGPFWPKNLRSLPNLAEGNVYADKKHENQVHSYSHTIF